MATYTPDRWVVVKIISPKYGIVYKVLATWYGGYAGSDSWKLNSGITRAEYVPGDTQGYWNFYGSSGSVYRCWEGAQGLSMLAYSVLEQSRERIKEADGTVEVMPDTTQYQEINYA